MLVCDVASVLARPQVMQRAGVLVTEVPRVYVTLPVSLRAPR